MYLQYGNVPRDEFIESNLPLVWSVVKGFAYQAAAMGVERDDLFGWGCIGLVKAYDGFVPSFGFKWTTYAVVKIRGEIQLAFRDCLRPVTDSRSVLEVVNYIQDGDTAESVAETHGLSLNIAKRAIGYRRLALVSMDTPVTDDGTRTVSDLLFSDDDISGLLVEEFLGQLSQRRRKIIKLRMLGMTQKEIAERCRVSQVQVSRELVKIKQELQTG